MIIFSIDKVHQYINMHYTLYRIIRHGIKNILSCNLPKKKKWNTMVKLLSEFSCFVRKMLYFETF